MPEYLALREESDTESEDESVAEGEDHGEEEEEEMRGSEAESSEARPDAPKVDAKTLAALKKRTGAAAAKATPSQERGVVYIGNIPFGFFEDEMRQFFSQFGDVTRLRMSRGKRTGRSRGYGFAEFAHKEVAEIVAETMNNYLMFNRVLKCQFLPADSVHPDTFKNAHRAFHTIDWRKFEQRRHNKPRSEDQQAKLVGKLRAKDAKKREKLAALGIDYEFAGYVCVCVCVVCVCLRAGLCCIAPSQSAVGLNLYVTGCF